MKITVTGLTKKYGENIVLDKVDLKCTGGTVYCLLGRNGVGKSTLINLLSDLIEATSGDIYINEHNYKESEILIKKQTGLLSQYDQLIHELNASDYLHWIGLLYGLHKETIAKQSSNLLDFFFDSDEDLRLPCSKYSSGMKKKLAVCAAVLHKPNFLLLDEPFANLDPLAASKLCDFLNAYKSCNRVILVSSHDLLYVDKLATHIGVLSGAQLVYDDTISAFKNNTGSINEELLKYLKPKDGTSSLLNTLI
ncbi:ABC transporter ATP-binding protein [Pedobacter sp. N36a]|uniref:ABC transporter ATP-binding protein n=1 Tax=Pedobacter sp. N36a TaxID=2767996 RepID=UPI001656A9D2|nr:ABC transporter ATP-binding protein [Pedobacter sp. N36a]MBC8988165.1 ABC transporter ATP-binding protein [Pedobacter sp. N36a]